MENLKRRSNKTLKLFIDTSNRNEVKVAIKFNSKLYKKTVKNIKSQNVLQLIDELLRENKFELKDIREIEVNTGPGSFTGLRVGISVANALGFALKIPVNGKRAGLVQPVYNK